MAEVKFESYCKLLITKGGIRRGFTMDCPKLDNIII